MLPRLAREACRRPRRGLLRRRAGPRGGETLDSYGTCMTYGEAVSTAEMSEKRYLPEGPASAARCVATSRRTR
jgi:hypothetical protein